MEASGDEVQTKIDEDSEPERSVPKKNRKVEPSTSSKPRSMHDMLKDADKKEGQMKKKYRTRSTEKEDIQEKTSCHQNTGSSRKDLMKSLLVYKKLSPYSTHINVIFMPSSQIMNDES